MTGQVAISSGFRNVDDDVISVNHPHRTVNLEKVKAKAKSIKMKDSLVNAICIRIQQTYKKSPEVSRCFAIAIAKRVVSERLDGNPSDQEFRQLMKDAAPLVKSQMAQSKATNAPKAVKYVKKSKAPRQQRTKQRQKNNSGSLTNVFMTESQIQQASIGFKASPRASPSKIQKRDIWSEMVDHSTKAGQEAERKKNEKAMELRKDWVSVLESQKAGHRSHQEHLENENKAYYAKSMELVEKQNEAERQKDERRLRIAKEQNACQAEQRRLKEEKMEAERKALALQEKQMVAMIKQQQEDDKEREMMKKLQEKEKMSRVLAENEAYLERKKQQKQQERDYETKLAEEYIEMEKAKDEARKAALDEMSKKVQAKMKYFEDTSKAEMLAKEKAEELRCLKYQAEYDEKARQEERRRKEALALRNKQQVQVLKQQVEFKRKQEQRDRDELNSQAEIWKREHKAAERKQRTEDSQRRNRNRTQQEWLKDQMKEREQQMLSADQTALEIQLNKSLLISISKEKKDQGNNVVSSTKQRSDELIEREKRSSRNNSSSRGRKKRQ